MTPIEAAAKEVQDWLLEPVPEPSHMVSACSDIATRAIQAWLDASEPLWVQKWKCADERGCEEPATLLVKFEDERMPVCHSHFDTDDVLVGLAFERVDSL